MMPKPFNEAFDSPLPIIGMIHLPPLPGYPDSPGIEIVVEKALLDLESLRKGGADGVLIENEYDQPHRVRSNPETTAAMTLIADRIVQRAGRLRVGVEILLNDPKASLAAAAMSGAHFIRTDYFVDRMARDEYGGEMEIIPQELIEYRQTLESESIQVLADIQVKYAKMLEPDKPLSISAQQAARAGASAAIVSGCKTGEPPETQSLIEAQRLEQDFPILIGSGLNLDNARHCLPYSDGAIVGTGIISQRKIDIEKVRDLIDLRDELLESR